MKTKKCILCESRRARQQEWKTEKEKSLCFTCYEIEKFALESIELIRSLARTKGVDIEVDVKIKKLTNESSYQVKEWTDLERVLKN